MFQPFKLEQASPLEEIKAMRSSTKGRFAEFSPTQAQAHSSIDKQWIEKANPEYIKQ